MLIQDRKDIPRSLFNYQSGHPIRWQTPPFLQNLATYLLLKRTQGHNTSQSLSSTEKVLWDFWLGTDRAHLFFPWSTKPGISLLIIFVQTYISAKNVTRHIRILEPAYLAPVRLQASSFVVFVNTQYFLYIRLHKRHLYQIRIRIRSLQKFKGRYDKTGTVSLIRSFFRRVERRN